MDPDLKCAGQECCKHRSGAEGTTQCPISAPVSASVAAPIADTWAAATAEGASKCAGKACNTPAASVTLAGTLAPVSAGAQQAVTAAAGTVLALPMVIAHMAAGDTECFGEDSGAAADAAGATTTAAASAVATAAASPAVSATAADAEIHKWLYAAADKYPYYARGFAAMTPVQKLIAPCGTPTIGVDKYWRLYWSPEALQHLGADGEPAELLRHELEHLLREHSTRCQDRQPGPWNYAGDCEINDDLDAAALPRKACMPDVPGKTAEEYYDELPVKECMCGGGSGAGNPLPDELPEGEAPGVSDTPELLDDIARDVESEAAQGRGTVPDGCRLWAQARLKQVPVLPDWRLMLRRRVREYERGCADYTFSRMSRRQGSERVILPGMHRPVGRCTVVLDTSGSMGGLADWVAGVLHQIGRTCRNVQLLDCDAAVHQRRPLRSWRDVLNSKGGGGTDMRVGIEAAPKRDLVIVVTDGETPWPEPWPSNLVAVVYNGERTEVKTS